MSRKKSKDSDSASKSENPWELEHQIDKIEKHQENTADERVAGSLPSQQARSGAEKLLTRTTSGIVYVLITLVALALGSFATTVLVAAEAWLCCSEYFRICRMGGRMPNEYIGLAAAILLPLAAYVDGLLTMTIVIYILLIAVMIWFVITPRASLSDVAVTVFGPLYTSLSFSSLVLVRVEVGGWEGAVLVLGIMASIWLNDAAAYLVGSALGRHKLAPSISPNKTWEGCVGGIVVSVLIWVLLEVFFVPDLGLPLAFITGIVVGVASVVGDLFESRLKRGVGVKDSGNVMPGHGGLLDRSDSMLLGALAAYFMLRWGGIL